MLIQAYNLARDIMRASGIEIDDKGCPALVIDSDKPCASYRHWTHTVHVNPTYADDLSTLAHECCHSLQANVADIMIAYGEQYKTFDGYYSCPLEREAFFVEAVIESGLTDIRHGDVLRYRGGKNDKPTRSLRLRLNNLKRSKKNENC